MSGGERGSRQLEYKAAWYGRTLVKIDRWYPSSKTCSACGFVLETLDLDEREWTCPRCGSHHDRDINAARNILLRYLTVNRKQEPINLALGLTPSRL